MKVVYVFPVFKIFFKKFSKILRIMLALVACMRTAAPEGIFPAVGGRNIVVLYHLGEGRGRELDSRSGNNVDCEALRQHSYEKMTKYLRKLLMKTQLNTNKTVNVDVKIMYQ